MVEKKKEKAPRLPAWQIGLFVLAIMALAGILLLPGRAHALAGHLSTVWSLAFSTDSSFLASA